MMYGSYSVISRGGQYVYYDDMGVFRWTKYFTNDCLLERDIAEELMGIYKDATLKNVIVTEE